MLERGSFITQHIDCKDCLKNVRCVLLQNNKQRLYFQDMAIPSPIGMDVRYAPIIAGYISSVEPLTAISYFNKTIRKEMEDAICMDLYIAVLSDGPVGKKIVVYTAKDGVKHEKTYKGKKE